MATISMTFLRTNLPNFVQFKQYRDKLGPHILLFKARFLTTVNMNRVSAVVSPPCPDIIWGNSIPQKYLGEWHYSTFPLDSTTVLHPETCLKATILAVFAQTIIDILPSVPLLGDFVPVFS